MVFKEFLEFNHLTNEDVEVIDNFGTPCPMQDGFGAVLGEFKDVPAPNCFPW